MQLKYIIFDGALPVVFGEYFKHSDVVINNGSEPTSAGFCFIKEAVVINNDISTKRVTVTCFGESTSLKLKSLPSDNKMIEKLFSHNS